MFASKILLGCYQMQENIGLNGIPLERANHCWQNAVFERDNQFDEIFVYAVRTTGIYCRPSCPSRAAYPENMIIFGSGFAAEKSGYRPCKRCTPDFSAKYDENLVVVVKICRFIESVNELPSLSELANKSGLSPSHLHRIFKLYTGITPKAYGSICRSKRMQQQLLTANSVTEAIFDSGYNASSRFYAESCHQIGMKPSQFRKKGFGTTMRFAIGQCNLGAILVATTKRGICAIELGDDPRDLVEDFQARFNSAQIVGADTEFEKIIAHVVGLAENPIQNFSLPLDIQGTIFQRKVWDILRKIPVGTTKTYLEVAKILGQPSAVRAVAGACASNKLAIVIPCHRVIKSDGKLSGYRWGVERKAQLLEQESRISISRD